MSRHIDAEIETDIIEPLSDVFRNNDYEIAPVLRQLLESEHFYDEDDADTYYDDYDDCDDHTNYDDYLEDAMLTCVVR